MSRKLQAHQRYQLPDGTLNQLPLIQPCAHCHSRMARPGRVLCVECKEKQTLYKSKRIMAGLCRSCGGQREPEQQGKTRCISCAKAESQYAKEHLPFIADHKNEQQRQRYWRNPKANNEIARGWRNQARLRVYEAYGGATCSCCGETRLAFLTLDHIANDGHIYRKKSARGERRGGNTYLWAIKNNFPLGLRVSCYNCNSGRFRNNGICPHEEEAHNGIPV